MNTDYYEGYIAGLTAYAAAVGHSGLKSQNELLRALMEQEAERLLAPHVDVGAQAGPPRTP